MNIADMAVVAESTVATSCRARPTRVPSALHKEQIALFKSRALSGLERSDRKQ